MDIEKLQEHVDQSLSENPEVFPSGNNIAILLRKGGKAISMKTVHNHLELVPIQLKWIKSCDEKIFLENLTRKGIGGLNEKCKEAIRERFRLIVKNELINNLETFPGCPQIAEMFEKKYDVKLNIKTIRKYLDVPSIQIKWIESSDELAFLNHSKKGVFRNLDKEIRKAAKQRFEAIVKEKLDTEKDVFPSGSQIIAMLKKSGITTNDSTIRRSFDLIPYQLEWVQSSKEKAFIKNLSNGTFCGVSVECKAAVKKRVQSIVENKLQNNPNIFPGSELIAGLLETEEVTVGRSIAMQYLDLVSLQVGWIESADEDAFLETQSKGIFSGTCAECRDAVKKRFTSIAKMKVKSNPEVFPSSRRVASLFADKKIAYATVNSNLDSSLQVEWIKSADEGIFLENLSAKRFVRLDEKCRKAIDNRMYKILLSHINDVETLPIHRSTLGEYLRKFPDVAFLISAAQEQRFTFDQRLVLSMRMWRETREQSLHDSIGERLDQLWGFRELYALTKSGKCLSVDMISPFHETLPEKITGYVPEVNASHFFVDALADGSFKASQGNDVLLLSFMHWLSNKQAAKILLRLNKSVGTENPIWMTTPDKLNYSEEFIAIVEAFGFTPERTGILYLLPPDDVETETNVVKKLFTKSRVLQMKKIRDVDNVPIEAPLFREARKTGNEERPQPSTEIVTYARETLDRAIPLISMRDFRSVLIEEIPNIRKILFGAEECILELKGDSIVGFNMDPKYPYSFEIEGKKIPKGTDDAILAVIEGREKFKVSKRMKADYKKFVRIVQEKKEKITSVKRTVLK